MDYEIMTYTLKSDENNIKKIKLYILKNTEFTEHYAAI